jgi:hypothetical protein
MPLVARQSDLSRPIDNADLNLRKVIEEYVRMSTSSRPLDIRRRVVSAKIASAGPLFAVQCREPFISS